MKTQLPTILVTILITILRVNCYAQISFEKGYYINNDEQKVECEIKNLDWKNNPKEFQFRISENTEQKKATIEFVKEFGIYNFSKYVRSNVNIDRSSKDLNNLSTDRKPIFKEEQLFLKVLIEGKSNLYQYEDRNLVRFFYSKDNSNNIEQLIFKNYKISANMIGENSDFKQQLLNNLKCQDIKTEDIKKTKYGKDYLEKIFIQYNKCSNSEVINFVEKQKKDLFNLNPRIGLNSSSLAIQNTISSSSDVDFGSKLGSRLGIEAEFILPFNKNKWTIIVEPTYQYFKSEKVVTTLNGIFDAKVDYKSIELPIGIRHYFFINSISKLFINGSYILDFTSNSTISYFSELEITKSSNLGFGVGFKQNDKYSLELGYHTSRGLLNNYSFYSSNYNTLSVILGYTVF